MKKLFLILMLLLSFNAFAKGSFGGSRSAGFSSSRSSFGGSRASSGASIYRTATPSRSYAVPSVTHSTTVIHTGSSGGGFWNGMMWGSMMNRPVVAGGYGNGTVVMTQGPSWGSWILIGLVIVGFIWVCFLVA